ncbi:MAG TPA: hypothetical protein VJ327_01895 [Patescibacteria group bacterium]|nr:hypothetical protein [Patescibacteria group bacterium]
MTRYVSDVLRIIRLAINRRNENDSDSSDTTLLQYLNDFTSLTMTDDLHVFEQFGALSFDIDGTTDGVYTFPSNETSILFSNLSSEILISLAAPVGSSVSWNPVDLYQDPGVFHGFWGINNEDLLTPGFPTEVLYYGNQLVFRTIPNDTYTVKIYGYKINPEFSSTGNEAIPHDYWLRYLAYGSAVNYAMDYRFDQENIGQIQRGFNRERRLLLTRTHNQIKQQRSAPRF